jgi:type 1 glutamine amidotransferase
MTSRWPAALGCVVSFFFIAAPAIHGQQVKEFSAPGRIRALIFSGHNNHDWRASTPYLKQLLLRTGRFDVRVEEEPAGTTSVTLAAYDVLVLDYMGPRWGEVTEKAVEEFVKSGKGLVVVHGASYAFTGLEILGDGHKPSGIKQPPWLEYLRMIGGYWTDAPPKTSHGQYHSFSVKIVDREHAITQGMKETFLATDELYHRMKMQPEAKVLARAYDDPKMGGTGKDEPVLWTVHYGRGRVFQTTLGHDLASMQEPGFAETFVRGTEWAATGAVTLPPKIDHPEARTQPLRILVVTGGHDYPTAFYTLFEHVPGFEWQHAASNHEAFRSDIRPKFDVLVLYDMHSEIGDAERKNLVDFLESGKGMVVLHHAIADYPAWDWWSREVVGGKYLLKAEGGMPASTFLHDQELFVEPVGSHPILSGINRMHLWDETYKGMWISPNVTVLLRTDNRTSDGPVAWVSPYEKSRVVYIQLGHDQLAHQHPTYQKLVHNAILWSAGRPEAK